MTIPETVEDAWEAIATVWGWPPREMHDMSLPTLMDWYGRAERHLRARQAR
ncbi:MAG: GpE family phage tail protein [Zoogloeaceae bacterium]|nr:GpE family phage tail protein [Zoogloeaceae bacterium]